MCAFDSLTTNCMSLYKRVCLMLLWLTEMSFKPIWRPDGQRGHLKVPKFWILFYLAEAMWLLSDDWNTRPARCSMQIQKTKNKQSTHVVYDWRTAVVWPGDRRASETGRTVVIAPATVQRVPCRHALATRRVDTARLNWHTRYLHNHAAPRVNSAAEPRIQLAIKLYY